MSPLSNKKSEGLGNFDEKDENFYIAQKMLGFYRRYRSLNLAEVKVNHISSLLSVLGLFNQTFRILGSCASDSSYSGYYCHRLAVQGNNKVPSKSPTDEPEKIADSCVRPSLDLVGCN